MTVAREPSFDALIEAGIRRAMQNLSVCIPAQVQSYDANAQTVDVRPCVDATIIDEEREQDDQFPVIYGVPLVFPGAGLYRLTFPIAQNDYVLLVFADRSTDEFVDKGGVNVPADLRQHHISDAFAIPGVTPKPNALSNVNTGVMVLGKNGNTSHPAARKDDGAGGGSLVVAHVPASGAGVSPCTLSITYNPGDGSSPQILPAGSGTINVKEKITAGSADVEIT